MSEMLAGVDFVAPEPKIHDAAAVILVRGAESGAPEVFWARRGRKVSFSGGFHAFPGGKVDREDGEVPIAAVAEDERAIYVCALRELFEEAGVLLAFGVDELDREKRHALRRELLDGGSFRHLLEREGLRLDGRALIAAGRWLTPEFSAIRFDARFFVASVPYATEASVLPGELSEGGWVRPADALARWELGDVLLHPPNQHALATLAGFPFEAAVPRLRRPPFQGLDHVVERIEFQRGILFFPLRTPTLPPARHTHCYVVGSGALVVIDPGSPYPDEQDRLLRFLRELISEGRWVTSVLLTHYHADHVGGALVLGAALGVPVRAHASTASRIAGVVPDLDDGQVIDLPGPRPIRLRCLLTEGHARGHIAFLDEASKALIAGDLVAGGSTIVIDPPEGDLGVYLASLRRLRALGVGTLYPAHGFAIRDGVALLGEYLDHREARMEAIRRAHAAGKRSLDAIVSEVYSDTPMYLFPVARRSALASLHELARRAVIADGSWSE